MTIALSTPRLWASLHLPLNFILSKPPRVPAVAQWLQLSGAALYRSQSAIVLGTGNGCHLVRKHRLGPWPYFRLGGAM